MLTPARDRDVLWSQDRIRAIANALDLQTILWGYNSFDWHEGQDGFSPADVDAKYELFVDQLTAGKFDTVGGILLTHELSNFTMQEAKGGAGL